MRPIVTITLLTVVLSLSFAATINVPDDITTIQGGIDSAVEGDTILVAAGTYYENLEYKGKNICVISVSGPEETIIDGSTNGPVVLMVSGETNAALLEGFTIQHGTGVPSLTNPDATFGGGICLRYNASPTLRDLIVKNNSVTGTNSSGGGIGISTGSQAVLEDIIIEYNSAFQGAGLYGYYASPTLRNVTIRNNSASASGGGAGFMQSSVKFYKVLINNNIATDSGGGLWFHDKCYARIINSTITKNKAFYTNGGGALIMTANCDVFLLNSIAWDNSAPNISSYVTGVYPANTIGIAYSDIEGGEDGLYLVSGELALYEHNQNTDPLCVNPENKDFCLSDTSPCIDAGVAYYHYGPELILDLDSVDYYGAAPDMGAFEWEPALHVVEEFLPSKLQLHQNFPNPFNPSTQIVWSLPSVASVRLEIFNLKGELINTLVNEIRHSGSHSSTWDGTDFNGHSVESGIYLYRLTSSSEMMSKTMLLIR